MGRRLIVVLALALAVAITLSPAFAEVQNVKVSGDLNMFGAIRNNFGLTRGPDGNRRNNDESFIATQTRVKIDADLTDNVSAVVRLINERKWNSNEETKIDLDLAYVGLKEFLYSPLSLTIGRQELIYGNKLILGKSSVGSSASGIPTDLSLKKSFDAIKAVLNYDPLVVDLIYAKISEDSSRSVKDDANLYGIYASYDVNRKLKADVYGFYKKDRNKASAIFKNDTVLTVGSLITATPIDNLKTSLEAAMQFGKRAIGKTTTRDSRTKAWALQAAAEYTLSNVKFTPTIGASFTHLSGDKDGENGKRAWDSMFQDQALNNITNAIIPFTNLNVLNLKGSMKPTDDVTLCANWGFYIRDRKSPGSMISPATDSNGSSSSYGNYNMTSKKYLGNALDLTATYDYTEDVQFGLTTGWFMPGNAFEKDNRRIASQVIGSMKVTF
jgi:hypothetical protein